jgi:DNA replication protein DnaC
VAIANTRLALKRQVVFRFVPDLLDYLRRSYSPDSPVRYDREFDRIKNAELLILDDLGSQASTAWAEEKLYQIITHRHNGALPTVITSSVLLDDIEDSNTGRFDSRYSEAIASRLRDALVVVERLLTAPDFRHRGAAAPAKPRVTRTGRR